MKTPIRENEPLAPFTTLGIGGPARYFIHADSENTVLEAVELSKSRNLSLLVLGGGSNLLVADAGFPGLVVRVEIRGLDWADTGQQVRLTAGAGEEWDDVAAACVDRNLYGIECLSGIPGLVGGTPVQNVGAYGQEVSQTLMGVRAYDRSDDRIVELDRADCGFTYRSSVFNTTESGRYIILAVTYSLNKTGTPFVEYPDLKREFENMPPPDLAGVREAVRRVRARKAMLLQAGDPDCRSAGSFFKNPIVSPETFSRIEAAAGEKAPRYNAPSGMIKTAAAWLIERAGISKGYTLGRAGVSSKHTLALVNKDGASAADVIALAREIRRRVEARFGVLLVVEPVFVGFDDAIMREFRAAWSPLR